MISRKLQSQLGIGDSLVERVLTNESQRHTQTIKTPGWECEVSPKRAKTGLTRRPWNYSRGMKLHICSSVKDRLRELNEAEKA